LSSKITAEKVLRLTPRLVDAFDAVISTGLGRLSWIWELFMKLMDDPDDEEGDEFFEAIGCSMDGDGEGFFRYDFYDCWETQYSGIDIGNIEPILDAGHQQMLMEIDKVAKEHLTK
jgi:hypothetical protein